MPTFLHLDRVTVVRSGFTPGRLSIMHLSPGAVLRLLNVLHRAAYELPDADAAALLCELQAVCERDGVNLQALTDGAA